LADTNRNITEPGQLEYKISNVCHNGGNFDELKIENSLSNFFHSKLFSSSVAKKS